MQEVNQIRQYIVDYFSEGSKHTGDFKIGVELEHFVVEEASLKSVTYYSDDGVQQILSELLPFFPVSYYEDDNILALANDDYSITLEPGSQLEISINPKKHIKSIKRIYNEFTAQLKEQLKKRSCKLVSYGYLPKSSITDIKLLPKKRYRFMDNNFQKTGTMGRNMMRGTASCQVSIDYFNEADFVRKVRCAYVLSPVISYMSSNSPVFEGKTNNNPLLRTLIWRNTDKSRTGIIPGLFDDNFGFEKYADYVLEAPAIFWNNNGKFCETDLKVIDVMQKSDNIAESSQLYLSLVFPDVRLKQYIEIRIADGMPIERSLGYAAFLKGLFLNPDETEALFDKEHFCEKSIILAQDSLMSNKNIVYGMHIEEICKKLIKAAKNGLDENEIKYLKEFSGADE